MKAPQPLCHTHLKVIRNPNLKSAISGRGGITLVASGKGGVGKTWFSITLSHCLAHMQRRVLLFDGDLGLANVDIQLGLLPQHDLSQVVNCSIPLEEAILSYKEGGFNILAGQSGNGQLSELSSQRLMYLKESLKETAQHYEHVIIDLGAGVGDDVRRLSDLANRCVVIVTDEPTSLTDAYALIKMSHLAVPHMEIEVVINQADTELSGRRTFNTLLRVCENFLDLSPRLLGVVRRDTHVKDSICNQVSLLTRFPNCNAANDVKSIAKALETTDQSPA